MKRCPRCDQPVAEAIATCPACGQDLRPRREFIDDYRIVDVLHEGHASLLCRAIRGRTAEPVMIRLFTPQSGVNEEIASRLQREIEKLQSLPGEGLVRHHAIRRSQDGLWYRISEWVDAESWGTLLASGRLKDPGTILDLFIQTAETLATLHAHGHFIPHLILNDLLPVALPDGRLAVRIDYKLSRFIDPRLDRPAPMLRRLLERHPDIRGGRPLDFRSDIWSLGKIFVELLAGDLEIEDPEAKVDELALPPDLAVLLRVMLAEDPDLRPQSMAGIAASLRRIREGLGRLPAASPPPARRPARRRLLAASALLLLALAAAAWLALREAGRDTEAVLEGYANRYARSVGFVLVDYWLESEGERLFRNVSEGTAFLVDAAGYLLTSRHVVCPWLEDPRFDAVVRYARDRGIEIRLGYRLYLWFEGERAFNLAGRLIENPDLPDVYFLENAYSLDGPRRIEIAGVGRPPVRTRQMLRSPLKDDFAVIRVDPPPPGLKPLPLDPALDPKQLPKLKRVIALGFPLGSRTQVDTVNASVVRGNVRRAFETMFQIDASLHGGNSGGPVIDEHGRVIGIVSAVAVDFTQGLVPMVTPVWDIGLILPIPQAVRLLLDLKAGGVKWDGVPDFTVEVSLAEIRRAAEAGRWVEARALADEKLGRSLQPELVAASGVLRLATGDFRGARERFRQALSLDPEDDTARWMLVLIDRLAGAREAEAERRLLAGVDWKSPAEFQGYLLRVLEGREDLPAALDGWATAGEKAWLHFLAGILELERGRPETAEAHLETALKAAEPESWERVLVRARLDEVRKLRRRGFASDADRNSHRRHVERFEEEISRLNAEKMQRRPELASMRARLAYSGLPHDEKRALLAALCNAEPENRQALGALAFAEAAADAFDEALGRSRAFLESGVRENALRMSLGLLEAGILRRLGREGEARARLVDFLARTRDPFFDAVAETLLGRKPEEALRAEAGEVPEQVLVACTAAGFWAEGAGDRKAAGRLYRDAIGSFLDTWVEYEFALERIRRLKRAEE